MKLIIDIPEEDYKRLKEYEKAPFNSLTSRVYEAIANGTPIPDNATNGEWVDQYNDGNWHCSKCGAIVEKDEQTNHNWYFCYHCGKKMNAPYQKGGK